MKHVFVKEESQHRREEREVKIEEGGRGMSSASPCGNKRDPQMNPTPYCFSKKGGLEK